MKHTKPILGAIALSVAAGMSFADSHMADEMTIISWGGAYSASQKKAYHDPYSAMTGITIINDESSPGAVAKMRTMSEAGNITWDLVDLEAADAIRVCDEGLPARWTLIPNWHRGLMDLPPQKILAPC